MADLHIPSEVVEGARTLGTALGPAAIGATCSQAFKRGLRWTERLIQILVGTFVSYFVGGAIVAAFTPEPFLVQSIGFVLGMIAYEATPRFIHNAADVAAQLPAALRDRFLGRKGE